MWRDDAGAGKARATLANAGRPAGEAAANVSVLCPLWVRWVRFFFLDKVLCLGTGSLLPGVQQAVVRLGACLPFEQVREHLEALPWVQVSSSTVRRHTECVGEAALAVQTQQAKLLAACPQEEAGPYMAMSADGAYVPLMHGQWAEVKLVVIGEVERQAGEGAESEAHTGKLSYFARLAEIASFSDQVSSEVRRRGLEQAPVVVAVQDGAEWQQTLVQDYRHDAIRMLDCAHAAQRIAAIGEQVRERG